MPRVQEFLVTDKGKLFERKHALADMRARAQLPTPMLKPVDKAQLVQEVTEACAGIDWSKVPDLSGVFKPAEPVATESDLPEPLDLEKVMSMPSDTTRTHGEILRDLQAAMDALHDSPCDPPEPFA